MRWMHISDVHMNKEFNNVISNILRDELPEFIKSNGFEADYLFVTGDYRDSAYMADNSLKEDLYQQAVNVADYIQEIAKALHVSSDNIYLVPGNHDLARQSCDKEQIEKIKQSYPKFRETLTNQEQSYLLQRFEFFDMIEKQIHPEESNECRSFHRFYQEDKVDILCLNTAITCYGQEKEGELFLDSESVRKIISNTGIQRPLIILAHHDLKFLTPVEMENLKFMIRNRSVFYLCGHSHKLEYGYDDESKICRIMVGTTKHAEGAYPIISMGDISDRGDQAGFTFYKYNFADKTGWNLYNEFSYRINKNRIGFIGSSIVNDTNINFDLVQLPLKQTTKSTKEERTVTLKTLAKIKSALCVFERKQTITVSARGLPVNAGIVIGYALHKRQGIQLQYKNNDILFSNANGKRLINFEEKVKCENIAFDKPISLDVYIQAKSRDDGIAAFYEFLKKRKNKNSYILLFANRENYDESFNLELSSEKLADKMIKHYGMLKQKGAAKININLFYNGFWGLALLLGNQMPTTFPIQLYDYEVSNQQYYKSFSLASKIFEL